MEWSLEEVVGKSCSLGDPPTMYDLSPVKNGNKAYLEAAGLHKIQEELEPTLFSLWDENLRKFRLPRGKPSEENSAAAKDLSLGALIACLEGHCPTPVRLVVKRQNHPDFLLP